MVLQMPAKPRIGLALSGGGFRAALFHLGVLKRVAESGWLSRIDVVSTVSGGSILGAFMALRWDQLVQMGEDSRAFQELVEKPFRELVSGGNFIREWATRLPMVPVRKLFDKAFTRTSLAAQLLNLWFFGDKRCSDLPMRPYLIVNATTLVSMRAWRFTRDGMGDSQIGHTSWVGSALTLGECVAASAAFPPVFPPLRLNVEGLHFSGPLYGGPVIKHHPLIAVTDGGVYDNMGVEALIKPTPLPGRKEPLAPPEFLIVSDAGAPTPRIVRDSGVPAWKSGLLLYRADEIAREQVSALRRRELMRAFQDPNNERSGLLVMLGSGLHRLPPNSRECYESHIGRHYLIPDEVVSSIHKTRTHLNRFSQTECEGIIYHAYTMTDCFLWTHRESLPSAYQIDRDQMPKWKIKFDKTTVASWLSAFGDG
jgi:NTE family protein